MPCSVKPTAATPLTLTDTNRGTGQLSILLAISSDPEPKRQYLDCYRRVRGLLGYADLQRFQDNDQPGESRLFVRIFYLDDNNQALASPPDKASIPSDPVPAYFKIDGEAAPGSATMSKAAESGPVDGYCFKNVAGQWQ